MVLCYYKSPTCICDLKLRFSKSPLGLVELFFCLGFLFKKCVTCVSVRYLEGWIFGVVFCIVFFLF